MRVGWLYWVPVPMLSRWKEQNPDGTQVSLSAAPGHRANVKTRPPFPFFGAPSKPEILEEGVVDFGVRVIWVCILILLFLLTLWLLSLLGPQCSHL